MCFQLLEFETSAEVSFNIQLIFKWETTSFLKNTLLQREPCLTMFYTMNLSPLQSTFLCKHLFWANKSTFLHPFINSQLLRGILIFFVAIYSRQDKMNIVLAIRSLFSTEHFNTVSTSWKFRNSRSLLGKAREREVFPSSVTFHFLYPFPIFDVQRHCSLFFFVQTSSLY